MPDLYRFSQLKVGSAERSAIRLSSRYYSACNSGAPRDIESKVLKVYAEDVGKS